MAGTGSAINIPTRLEEPGRVLIFEQDEFMVLAMPVFFGMISKHLIPGIIIGVVFYFAWTRLKGEQGFYALWAMIYWAFPKSVSGLKDLPESAVSRWRA